ncbi:hypothetical protein SAMN04487992_1064 [Cellulophaga baltica]|uniref:Uncharacterized protein n=1 Tax=Cellulophaga baltica TaxID=76594 RepID=A0A1G7HDV9_9FLAO|nr:hypothetical protein SAMN04487992_1064 [Cellulophaga baltica]
MNYKILVLTMAISNCLFLPISENPRGFSMFGNRGQFAIY